MPAFTGANVPVRLGLELYTRSALSTVAWQKRQEASSARMPKSTPLESGFEMVKVSRTVPCRSRDFLAPSSGKAVASTSTTRLVVCSVSTRKISARSITTSCMASSPRLSLLSARELLRSILVGLASSRRESIIPCWSR